ncbi:RNA methyltransferase [Desulfurispira natronophila]|uniref:tRNA/rRNA methyltransferase n=1 Tax=Desulfurispira natronophila TaxID=682562 RepID=A0A7W8DHR2_9BACT|nr:RNA methyltransferase [Desulfurispira natronophila]MBB5022709.1 tRNA/rRNA methyltransferase [Desulfurispira natronophila]
MNTAADSWKNECWVVLDRIEGPVNLGFISRAMANTGFANLRYSGELDTEDEEARRFAVHSQDLLKSFKQVSRKNLLDGMDVVVGLSPRQPWSDGHDLPLDKLWVTLKSALERKQRVALLFGNEAHGLDNATLAHCRYRLALPTVARYRSMNLAQAVLVVLWELHRQSGTAQGVETSQPSLAGGAQREQMLLKLRHLLETTGYLDHQNPEEIWQEMALIFRSRDWSQREMTLLTGMVNKVLKQHLACCKEMQQVPRQ